MAKNKPAAKPSTTAAVSTSKRAGYKRKSNRRVNVLNAQLQRVARKALRAASYAPKASRMA